MPALLVCQGEEILLRETVSGTSLFVLYPGDSTQATLVNGVITDDVATEYRRQ